MARERTTLIAGAIALGIVAVVVAGFWGFGNVNSSKGDQTPTVPLVAPSLARHAARRPLSPEIGGPSPAEKQSGTNSSASGKLPPSAGTLALGTVKRRVIDQWPPFVMRLCRDDSGNIWVGTEDLGIYRYNPVTGDRTHFTTRDGLGDDNAYALACDHQGRIWVGHLNHGVSVYNGKQWRNYDVLDGPIGARVFDIAVCPMDGDVWIATSAGLTRYSERLDNWTYYTHGFSPSSGNPVGAAQGNASVAPTREGGGLPSDQASSIAFDRDGNIYVGTQCDGIAMADAADDYKHWRVVTGPDRAPTEPYGEGLPTNLINDILVGSDGQVYAATTTGLAYSSDRGRNWRYLRGRDWIDKVHRRYGGPPPGWRERKGYYADRVIREDYVTSLAEGVDRKLYIGFRQRGWTAAAAKGPPVSGPYDQGSDLKLDGPGQLRSFVTAILPVAGGTPITATYGAGVMGIGNDKSKPAAATRPAVVPALPSAASPPTQAELQTMLDRLRTHPVDQAVVALPDDWQTEGDWLGRYGRYWACLCSMSYPEYLWGAGDQPIQYAAYIGPNHPAGDSIRHWVQRLYSKSPRALEMPPVYLDSRIAKRLTTRDVYRRKSSWDDHGETYPQAQEGPDLCCTMRIPPGLFYLSLYFMNKDGHDIENRLRDYPVLVRAHPEREMNDSSSLYRQPVLARGRVRNFWGGVYKRFLVRGPLTATIQIERHGSVNAIVSGVFLDEVGQRPDPYFPQALASHPPQSPASYANGRPYYLARLRRLISGGAETRDRLDKSTLAELATCYYRLGMYRQWERCQRRQGLTPARDIEKALRWDGHTPAYSGRERQTVIEYLSNKESNSATQPSSRPGDIPVPAVEGKTSGGGE